jgi:hypothetical protein
METKEPEEYTSPEVSDFGDLAELTQHEPFGDPHLDPIHGGDPHLTFSTT